VRNAISHSPSGGSVEIDASCVGREVRISVKDGGPGIPDDYIERVFDRFVQVPHRGGRGGAGLGLTIARNVARYHHGHISAHNNELGGATFVISLPLAPSHEPVPAESET
jgi:signal transduction histidine kinase